MKSPLRALLSRTINAVSCGITLLAFFANLGCNPDRIDFGEPRTIQLPVDHDITCVVFRDSLNGFACGGQVWGSGYILSTQNGGRDWNVDFSTDTYLSSMNVHSDSGVSYACGQAGIICKKEKNGAWMQIRKDYCCWYRDICISPNAETAFFASGEAFKLGVIKSLDHGSQPTIRYEGMNELARVVSLNDRVMLACGYGYVLRSTDAGMHWYRQDITGGFFTALTANSEGNCILISEDGQVYTSQDHGNTWVPQSRIKKARGVSDVAWMDESHAYACTRTGQLFFTQNSCNTWAEVANVPSGSWLSVAKQGESIVIAGKNGQMVVVDPK